MSKQTMLPAVPAVPFDPRVDLHLRFGLFYEAYEYTNWIDESLSWKEGCYIGDWSGLAKYRVTGPDAQRLFSNIAINGFATFEVGHAKHAVFCNSSGMVMGEGILMKEAEDSFVFTSGAGALWMSYRASVGDYDVLVENISMTRSIQQLQGPTSVALLIEAAGEDVRDIGFMRFRDIEIAGHRVTALRQGMSGELGFELHADMDAAPEIYAHLLRTGEPFGIRRLGGRTKMVNHVEAAFPTPSVDYLPAWAGFDEEEAFRSHMEREFPGFPYDSQVAFGGGSFEATGPLDLAFTPMELGWGKSVRFDHDFIGREALERVAASPHRVLRTLVWNADDVADVLASFVRKDGPLYDFMEWPRELLGRMRAELVTLDGRGAGIAMSRCYSVYFREMLSLAVLEPGAAEVGTEVTVVWGRPGTVQKLIRATVAAAPYKRDNRRVGKGA